MALINFLRLKCLLQKLRRTLRTSVKHLPVNKNVLDYSKNNSQKRKVRREESKTVLQVFAFKVGASTSTSRVFSTSNCTIYPNFKNSHMSKAYIWTHASYTHSKIMNSNLGISHWVCSHAEREAAHTSWPLPLIKQRLHMMLIWNVVIKFGTNDTREFPSRSQTEFCVNSKIVPSTRLGLSRLVHSNFLREKQETYHFT